MTDNLNTVIDGRIVINKAIDFITKSTWWRRKLIADDDYIYSLHPSAYLLR